MVCLQCPIGSHKAIGRETYYHIMRIRLMEELVPAHMAAVLSPSFPEGISVAVFTGC